MRGFATRGLVIALLFAPVLARGAPVPGQASPPAPAAAAGPAAAAPVDQSLAISDNERRAFALGDALARASFSYSPIVQQAAQLAHSPDRFQEVDKLAKLAPDAALARLSARSGLDEAVVLAKQLDAPRAAFDPIARLAARLDRPVVLSGDSLTLGSLNLQAADVLASLDEAQDLSLLLETPGLTRWLSAYASGGAGPVWYADGLMAGIAQIAARYELPYLLPRTADVATDLRGVRDWLASRLPETPTPDQDLLRDKIDQWLEQAPVLSADLGRTPSRRLPPDQLAALGQISALLRELILGSPGAPLTSAR
jgi:hypothetical protein